MHHSLQNLSVFNLSPRNAASGHIQFKGDRVSSQLPESNRRTRLCPFPCCVSAGLPRQGEKMLLHSLMRKKPDNFLSRHCYYSMFRGRGCKEKPPFLQIFLSFCFGQQNGSPLFISGLNFPFCSVSAAKFEQLLHFRLLRSRKSKLVHQIRYYILLLQILLTFIIV